MLEVAIGAIRKSGKLLKNNFSKLNSFTLKSKKDFVTNLDLASEKIILKIIKNKYPKHSFLSEEFGFEDNHSKFTWIIDPLCSTNNFAFGFFLYGIAIGLIFRKEPLLGVIYLPELDYLLTAQKNRGAFLNGKKICVSPRKRLQDALVLYDNQFYKDRRMYANLSKVIDKVFTVRILGSAAFDLSLVAMGKADARIFHKTKPCDFIAGSLIIEEAGGMVTNFRGERFSLTDSSIVASNGILHQQIIKVLQ